MKQELLNLDESSKTIDNTSSFIETESISLKDYGISYIQDILLDTIVYIVVGILLSKFIGSFYSGIFTFVFVIYLKYILKRETPIAYDIARFITE